ncbi:MAG TPA: TonB-dependent receptor plug domain-containing protein, partial [Saprospiraceae bacterium]|nr:TonB-dependent receptor plug domain-containing protein [Saprospiraceae bacterium]
MKKIMLLVSCLWIGGNFLYGQQMIKVVDAISGDPLPYALIALSDGFQQYVTDDQGNADMGAPRNSTVNFEISYLGYETYQGELLPESGTMLVTMQYQKQGLEEVLVTTTRVGNKGVFASQNVSGKELAKQNLGQDLPVLLNQATSVITSTDAGNGVGYTGIRVRGSDPTRINITINGIPVNDAESQGVYWVNMPDLASSLNSIQIQRGVGTSTNGAGAFGASINLQTDKLRDKAYFILDNSFGSFETRKHTFSAGTGLIDDKWAADVR